MADDHGKNKPWKHWRDVPQNDHLKREIDDWFRGKPPGEYCAVIVKVENPITGYKVVDVQSG